MSPLRSCFFLLHHLFPTPPVFVSPLPLAASVFEDGEASFQPDSSHSGSQRCSQEQPLVLHSSSACVSQCSPPGEVEVVPPSLSFSCSFLFQCFLNLLHLLPSLWTSTLGSEATPLHLTGNEKGRGCFQLFSLRSTKLGQEGRTDVSPPSEQRRACLRVEGISTESRGSLFVFKSGPQQLTITF